MRRYFVLVFFLASMLFAAPAAAQASRVQWEPYWPRFSIAEGIATGTLGTTAFVFGVLLEERKEARWNREIALDLPIRRILGSRRSVGEGRAGLVSDVLVMSLIAAPFAVHAAPVLWWHDNPDVAGQLALISLQSYAATFAVTNVTKVLVGRSRPRLADCFTSQLLDPTAECEPRPTVSFFSGHSSAAFTGAGLLCVVGNNVPIYGEGKPQINRVPCFAGLAGATATAILRIAANKHHFSDVLVGALVGLASGWMVPYLVHFRPAP